MSYSGMGRFSNLAATRPGGALASSVDGASDPRFMRSIIQHDREYGSRTGAIAGLDSPHTTLAIVSVSQSFPATERHFYRQSLSLVEIQFIHFPMPCKRRRIVVIGCQCICLAAADRQAYPGLRSYQTWMCTPRKHSFPLTLLCVLELVGEPNLCEAHLSAH
jgi:hypothetical protein